MKAGAAALIGAALLLGGAAPDRSPEGRLARAIDGRTPGEAVRCVHASRLGGPEPIGSQVLVYREARRVWVNRLPDHCPGLAGDVVLVQERWGSQICANDRVRAVPRLGGIPGAPCRLGPFVPYDRVS